MVTTSFPPQAVTSAVVTAGIPGFEPDLFARQVGQIARYVVEKENLGWYTKDKTKGWGLDTP